VSPRPSPRRAAVALAALAALALLAAAPAGAAHFVEEGNGCYACHTLGANESDPDTDAINKVARTLMLMRAYNGGDTPARFGCTFCHNSPSTAAMRDALSDFGPRPSKHPVGFDFVRRVETNGEYLSALGSATPNELDCVDCHDPQLLAPDVGGAAAAAPAPGEAEAGTEVDSGIPYEPAPAVAAADPYVNHVPPDDPRRANNPLMLRGVAAARRYDGFCRGCHGAAAAPVKGRDARLRSHADAAAAPLRESDGTPLRTTDAGGDAQCTACHDTHSSGLVRLLNDGHEGDTAVVGSDCTKLCHYAGDAAGGYGASGHGAALSTYRYRGGQVSFGNGSHQVDMALRCTSCHLSLDTTDTSPARTAHVRRPAAGTIQERYRVRFNLNLPLQGYDSGSTTGNPLVGICYSCHAGSDPHRGKGDPPRTAGCQDCHDEHAEGVGANRFMIPQGARPLGTYSPTEEPAPPPRTVRYTVSRLDPAGGEPRTTGLDFYREDGAGICDSAACHPNYSPLEDHLTNRNHSGGKQDPGSDCGTCHPHQGDPGGAWRATSAEGR
jgi:hypothetical protein